MFYVYPTIHDLATAASATLAVHLASEPATLTLPTTSSTPTSITNRPVNSMDYEPSNGHIHTTQCAQRSSSQIYKPNRRFKRARSPSPDTEDSIPATSASTNDVTEIPGPSTAAPFNINMLCKNH